MAEPEVPLGDDDKYVTRRELRLELKAQSDRTLLYLGIAVGLINFDVPGPVTATALALAVVKVGTAAIGRIYYS